MSVEFDYEASINGSGAQERVGRIRIPTSPRAASGLARTRPELLVGAAFAGGLLAALVLRRLTR